MISLKVVGSLYEHILSEKEIQYDYLPGINFKYDLWAHQINQRWTQTIWGN